MSEENVKVLLCEDDENLGMLLCEYLQVKGYNTDRCENGVAGYEAFLQNQYDICIFDVMMPEKDGFTLASEIRSISPDMPIIFLTAKNLKDD
ncbi:MAG: response regulator, partial [Paludibacteraceae bacterium]|nr:response regulator [Paludibacteraceae bacterium]